MKTLVAGWFSFPQMGATAGDLLSRDVACRWLEQANVPYDVALVPPFSGGIDWRSADPREYSHVIFICGPFGNGQPAVAFLEHFEGCRLIGLNLTMLEALDTWNPFDLLLERDSARTSRPDLVFLSPRPSVPVAAVVLAHPQREYKKGAMHGVANAALHRLTGSREVATIPIDTCLDPWNTTGLRTAGEIEATIARMDLVLTTRLHGMVLALKNGVPAIAIDPIAGGAKISRQAEAIGWPVVFQADTVTDKQLTEAFNFCLGEGARTRVSECRAGAMDKLRDVRRQFLASLDSPGAS